MPVKPGGLTTEEIAFITDNMLAMSVPEIAAALNRSEKAVMRVVAEAKTRPKTLPKVVVPRETYSTEAWRGLKRELTDEEMRYFEEGYLKLMSQFKNDVLPTEETQIFDCIKFEILKHRNLVQRRQALDEIARVERQRTSFLAGFKRSSDMTEEESAKLTEFDDSIASLRAAEQSRTTEYVKLQERHDNLMKTLKATRDQRVKEFETSKESILGLFKLLATRDAQEKEGREMELFKIAARRAYTKMGELHKFQDGALDRPILSPDTVADADASVPEVDTEGVQ